jgi:flagellar assembly protein FliH
VVQVADDALNTLLSSAKQITVNMHPDDFALAKGALMEQLESRGARVVADAHVNPGGCVVSSDIAVVDARVEARWARAAAAMGMKSDWADGPGTPTRISSDLDEDGSEAEALPNTEAGAVR